MRVDIAPAASADIPALAEIEKLCPHAAGWGEKGLQGELAKKNALVLGASVEGRAAGFICAEFIAPESQILNIAVHPGTARKGIATALFAAFAAEAAKRGCNLAALEVNERNLPAIRFYEKLGFKIVGRRAKFYNGSQDALLMDLALASAKGAL
jgi:ribosomal-protein-alanine N-acetyltransferase